MRLWKASAISDVGSQVTMVALPLIAAISLGATPWQMGLLSAASSAPILLVGLFAGVWVDRLRRRPLMIAADVGRAALLLLIPLAAAAGTLRMELLYVVALSTGALSVLFDVAYLSFLPTLVERDELVEANGKLEVSASVAQVVGPGLGGTLVGTLGAAVAVMVDAVSFLVSALFLRGIRGVEPRPAAPAESAGVTAEIVEGLRAVARHRILRALAFCSASTNLFGRMFLAVYVLYMTRDLGLDSVGVGLVFATGGIGALAGSLVAGSTTRWLGPGSTMIWAQLVFGVTGLAVPLAVLVPRYALPLVVGSEFTQWMAIVVYYVSAVSVRQALVPDRLRGRVNATMRFLAGGAMPIGAVIAGALGGMIGVPWTLVVASLGMLLGFAWLLLSPVRGLRELPAGESGAHGG
ncbi:MAG TPA: MFS transporter [Candidatus Limnocylindrales bacterium]|nr:MFS transporter [Candidatus Limnocylindrales bacterium]